jgi:hypothetical protein
MRASRAAMRRLATREAGPAHLEPPVSGLLLVAAPARPATPTHDRVGRPSLRQDHEQPHPRGVCSPASFGPRSGVFGGRGVSGGAAVVADRDHGHRLALGAGLARQREVGKHAPSRAVHALPPGRRAAIAAESTLSSDRRAGTEAAGSAVMGSEGGSRRHAGWASA